MANFPGNMVSYELALDSALRERIGDRIDYFPMPDQDAISEAYFHKIPPMEFADKLIEEEKHRPPEELSDDEQENSSTDGDTSTGELF